MQRWAALVVLPVVAAGAAIGLVSWIGAERGIHPRAHDPEHSPEDAGLAVEPVRFTSLDGTRLSGWFVPGLRRGAVILAHGYGSRREEMLPHAAFLHQAGYSVLLFDFRHAGESEGAAVTVGAFERLDVLGAVRFLRSRAETKDQVIVALGVSMGAAAAILAAAESDEIAGVVAECAFRSIGSVIAQSFRYFVGIPAFPCAPITVWLAERRVGFRARNLRPDRAISRLGDRPVLLIHGLDDVIIDPSNSHALHAAGGKTELWLVESAPHARAYQTLPEEYRQRVLTFIEAVIERGSAEDSRESRHPRRIGDGAQVRPQALRD
jgi:fermentation-respiration switch protein FrsA (DUF1100 family)